VVVHLPYELNALDTTGKTFIARTALPTIGTPNIASYGTNSALFNGSTSGHITSGVPITISNTHTIEFWIQTSSTALQSLCGVRNGVDYELLLVSGNLYLWNGGNWETSTGIVVSDNNPHYFAIVCEAGSFRIYKNGSLVHSVTPSSGLLLGTDPVGFAVGVDPILSQFFNGRLKDFRFTNNVARYSGSSMTVPTSALPTS
jgi:hypothetical protein